jgi:hypothetical protein
MHTLLEKIQKKYCNSESSELLNFFVKTYEKFSIFYWNKQSWFNFQKNLLNRVRSGNSLPISTNLHPTL